MTKTEILKHIKDMHEAAENKYQGNHERLFGFGVALALALVCDALGVKAAPALQKKIAERNGYHSKALAAQAKQAPQHDKGYLVAVLYKDGGHEEAEFFTDFDQAEGMVKHTARRFVKTQEETPVRGPQTIDVVLAAVIQKYGPY